MKKNLQFKPIGKQNDKPIGKQNDRYYVVLGTIKKQNYGLLVYTTKKPYNIWKDDNLLRQKLWEELAPYIAEHILEFVPEDIENPEIYWYNTFQELSDAMGPVCKIYNCKYYSM